MSVLVVVYTADGQLLLLQRADDPDFWQSVTGSLDEGELPPETALRELQEETGLTGVTLTDCQYSALFEIRPRWRYRYPPGTTHNREHVFLAELEKPQPIMLQPAEHLAYCWTSIDEGIEKMWSNTNRDAVKRFVQTD